MNFHDYASARQGPRIGGRFDGGATRLAIEKLLGVYAQNKHLSLEFIRWGEALTGLDIFDGIDENKWRFVSL
jgi:hypothetical protein